MWDLNTCTSMPQQNPKITHSDRYGRSLVVSILNAGGLTNTNMRSTAQIFPNNHFGTKNLLIDSVHVDGMRLQVVRVIAAIAAAAARAIINQMHVNRQPARRPAATGRPQSLITGQRWPVIGAQGMDIPWICGG